MICSPYLTPRTALSVIQASSPERCEIYTRFSIEDFASGASSLPVLKSILQDGYAVFEVQALHAKILLASKQFASIGSQNMTARGVRNREATYCTEDAAEVAHVEQMLEPWLDSATPITEAMVEDALRLLPPVKKAFRAAQSAAAEMEAEIRAAEAERLETTKRELNRRNEKTRSRHLAAKMARKIIDAQAPNGQISRELAQSFIRRSTFWHSHSSGHIVSGRGHAKRVYGVAGDWKVDFGANSFLVGRAIRRCFRTVEEYIDKWEAGQPQDASETVRQLRRDVNGAVAGYDGVELSGYYSSLSGNDMMFGTTSIDIKFFVRVVLEGLPEEISAPLRDVNEAQVGI
ncbi:phospholipase D-like domain-containing protein [Noviherbaspirillum sp. CPCC 100848]|uniref:Phospholipase D-like domain-containing protein n=1 Tax=Noviherbaspirillum album TaxID=3080276 RepID=A0ABU6JHJ6_9BURK|nr:phospholipase D-like domain-containing protein [Noviherbaspirillum sp. CPCC 100848]